MADKKKTKTVPKPPPPPKSRTFSKTGDVKKPKADKK